MYKTKFCNVFLWPWHLAIAACQNFVFLSLSHVPLNGRPFVLKIAKHPTRCKHHDQLIAFTLTFHFTTIAVMSSPYLWPQAATAFWNSGRKLLMPAFICSFSLGTRAAFSIGLRISVSTHICNTHTLLQYSAMNSYTWHTCISTYNIVMIQLLMACLRSFEILAVLTTVGRPALPSN
jgi:hypothetical protein